MGFMGASMSKRTSVVSSRASGFTLIELLTVVAIIGILAAIIIPTVGHVRAKARVTQSTSNLRQAGNAILLYGNDNRNELPGRNDGTNTGTGNLGLSLAVHDNYSQSQLGRLGRYIGPYAGADLPEGETSVTVPVLEDPVARDATGDESATLTLWVLNQRLEGGDNHYPRIASGTVLRPFGSNDSVTACAPMRHNEVASVIDPASTWMMLQADKGLASVSGISADAFANAPDKPATGAYRIALFFDGSVRKLGLDTNLDRPITNSL